MFTNLYFIVTYIKYRCQVKIEDKLIFFIFWLVVYYCAPDPVRAELDRCLLTEVLGITSDNVLESMQTLREMLCAEPSIHGGKQSQCDLDAELVGLKKKGVAFPSWYDV